MVVLRCAWVSDDAYFTFRTVENTVAGEGLRFNILERVQAYTHPLWMLCLVVPRGLGLSCFWSAMLLSFAFTAALGLLLARARPAGIGALPLLLLASSKAFVDFSTSGLENPLGHLLLVLFCLMWVGGAMERPRVWPLGLVASLMICNRMDTVLLVGPALGYLVIQRRSASVLVQLALGALPLVAWECFSLVYYGSLVPNTYHAKLTAEVPLTDSLAGGIAYARESLRHDWITLPAIATAAAIAVAKRQLAPALLAAGMITYVVYVVWIGGDFMIGRFFTMPFVVAVALLASAAPRFGTWPFAACATVVLALGLASPRSPLLSGSSYGELQAEDADPPAAGMVDERAYYFGERGLLRATVDVARDPIAAPPRSASVSRDDVVVRIDPFGSPAFAAPPGVHVVNTFGLSDPLLARLEPEPGFRVGHPTRDLPEGYLESLETGENRIVDPTVARLYDDVRLAVSGPVWSAARWGAIWRLAVEDDA